MDKVFHASDNWKKQICLCLHQTKYTFKSKLPLEIEKKKKERSIYDKGINSTVEYNNSNYIKQI